jgi:simple sugar transport system substrate-binding protein
MSRFKGILLLLIVVSLLLAACGGTEAPAATEAPEQPAATEGPAEPTAAEEPTAPQVTQSDLVFGMAVHAPPAEALFWGVVEKGARDAAAALGVELKSGGSRDPTEQSALIEDYVSSGANGIIVSLANPDAMRDSIQKAIDADIPVITINSGVNVYKDFGALTHVGQTEFIAGQGAGEKFTEMGFTKALCVIHEEANIALEERCDGLADTFSGEVERFNIASTGIEDPAGSLATIQDKLTSDPSFDSVLTLNPTIAMSALDAIKAAGGGQALATFDLSPAVLEAIQAGEMEFAIDQQQYLQGYLPVVFLYLYNVNANTVGGGLPVLTGPGFVDASNAADVVELAGQGTR